MIVRRWLGLLAVPALGRCLAPTAASADAPEQNVGGTERRPIQQASRLRNKNQTLDVTGSADRPTANYFLRSWSKRQSGTDSCLPELGGLEEFASPNNGLPRQLDPGGKVFLVGDSVIGQICQLGAPGLCCSSQRPCSGAPPFPDSKTSPHERQLDLYPEYEGKGWQHLFEFQLRDKDHRASGHTAYVVAPEVHDDPDTVGHSVKLVTDFLASKGASAEDVLVLGMVGTHFNHGLEVFEKFVVHLVQEVANPFPGRVVLLGYGPQHFAGAGYYTRGGAKACSPNPLPGDVAVPRNSFRSAIFLRGVWAHLTHARSRLVDFNDLLSPLWSCHRTAGDCTHWADPVVSFQAQLILDALEKVQ